MNRFVLPLAALLAAGVGMAHAQTYFQAPVARPPVVSPYLFRGGNPAVNYYGVVRPLEQQQQQLQLLSEQEAAPPAAAPAPGAIADTGRGSRFMAYGRYFNNVGGRPAYAAPATGQGAAFGRRPGG
jgi:hypothetical protein